MQAEVNVGPQAHFLYARHLLGPYILQKMSTARLKVIIRAPGMGTIMYC
jgi:hypothetical protein